MAGEQGQSPATEGTDINSIAGRIEGLLDDDGHYNPDPDQLSRGHPDYDESTDDRNKTPERDDSGRFKKAAAPEKQDKADPEAEDQLAAGDDPDEDTDTGDTDEDKTDSADKKAESDDAETDTIQTLEQLALALETPLEDLKEAITHTFRAADEDVTVTLTELEKGYQKDADYRRQTGKLADDRRSAESDYNLRMQQFDSQNQMLAATLNATEQVLNARLDDPRLAQLRQSDPAEWTAQRNEIGQQVLEVQQARQNAMQQLTAFRGQQQNDLKTREMNTLKQAIPDFGKKHADIARDVMDSIGYTAEEISNIFDNRIVRAALELSALRTEVKTLRDEKSKAKDTVQRVKKDVPVLVKPGKGTSLSKKGIKRDNVAKLRTRARQTGKVEDAAKVIESMI